MKKIIKIIVGLAAIPTICCSTTESVLATSNGSVTIEGTEVTNPTDPENPGTDVDPGEGPSTQGPLRIDFVSQLNFGLASTNQTNRRYNSLAQLFYSDTSARGYYVQVTDQRGEGGWTLKLRQEQQFTSSIVQDLEQQTLEGAFLSFGNTWANSSGNSGAPSVSNDTFAINEMNADYTVATAAAGTGKGTWTIAFGASEGNEVGQTETITPLLDENNQPVIDPTYKKPSFSNSAVFLQIPSSITIYPVGYTTVLTWSLEAGPTP